MELPTLTKENMDSSMVSFHEKNVPKTEVETKTESLVTQEPEKIVTPDPVAAEVAKPDPVPTPPQINAEDIERNLLNEVFEGKINSKAELKEYLKSLQEPESPFANEYIKGLNEYVKGGGSEDTYKKVVSLDIQSLDPLAAIKTLTLYENPELLEEDVELAIKHKYAQLEEADETDQRVGKVQMTQAAKEAKAKLTAIQQDNKIPEKQKLIINEQKAQAERTEKWKPVVKKLADDFSFEIPLGENKNLKVEVDPKVKQELAKELSELLSYNKLDYSEATVSEAKEFIKNRYILREFNHIINMVSTQILTDHGKETREKYENPTKPTGDAPPPARVSAADALLKKIEASIG